MNGDTSRVGAPLRGQKYSQINYLESVRRAYKSARDSPYFTLGNTRSIYTPLEMLRDGRAVKTREYGELSHIRYGPSLLLIGSRHKKNFRYTIKGETGVEDPLWKVGRYCCRLSRRVVRAPVHDNTTPRLAERARNQLGRCRIA